MAQNGGDECVKQAQVIPLAVSPAFEMGIVFLKGFV